jgi:hypothetical protein
MFDQLFFRSDALTRQLSAPLVDERRQYLAQCAAQGMSKCTLRMKARLLLSIAEYLRLAERPNDTISLPELQEVTPIELRYTLTDLHDREDKLRNKILQQAKKNVVRFKFLEV